MSGQYEAMAWQSSFSKKSKAKWNKIKESEHLKIFTFNVECFRSEKGKSEIIGLLERFKCMIVVDESQKIKTPSALRTKFIVKIGLKGIYRRILSGTPVTKGSEDFYSQLKFLNPNILGITAFAGFKNRYCQMGGWEGKVIVGYKNIEELQDKVDKYSMRVLKKDCLDLPEKLYQFSYFDLTKTQLDMIKQIKADGVAAIKDIKGDVTDEFLLEYVISRMIKIQQISNGYYYDTENKKVIEIIPFDKNPRLLKLKEDLDKIEGKVIIWCRFKEDIKLISKLLKFMGKSFAVYDGSVSQDDRKKNKKDFQDGLLDVLLLNIQTGATGLTLTVASNTIYFDNSYDLELRLQSEDRNHRIGTKYNVLYTDLVANDTPEKKIITALKRKKSISEIILKDPAGFFLEEK
jgi:SNF2 family DNA or RNA helicase